MSRAALALVRAVTPSPPDSDAQLLRAFLDARSEEAFAQLVRRHGPMVLATCRRVLSNAADADDAFQATFLVLARKAHAVRGANLGGWLYGVAVRTARGVRLMRDRRVKRETRAARTDVARPPAEPADADAAALVDAELARLPTHQREALVLCELQGRSRKAAAVELGIAEGTLSSRLAAAKRKLAERLFARGWRAFGLGPVAVPAALASATAALAHGAAHATAPASAAAAVVLKGMLFEQLRAGALACAVVLATVCGGFAMTGAPASDPPAPRGAAADPAVELVKQLGSAEFAKRVAAEKELRKLGATAEPALRAGSKSGDPEVRARSLTVLNQIRVDQRQAFLAGKADPPGTAWKRFKELVGDTEASRKLFLEMTADERRAATIERAEANPEKAAEVYAAEVARVVDLSDKSFAQFTGQPAVIPAPGQPHPIAMASREAVSLGDSVGVLFLGTRPVANGAKDPSATRALHASFSDGLNGPLEAPLRKLFVAWLDQRRDAALVRDGLETALFARVPEVLPIARRHAADAKLAAPAKGYALLAVGNYGTLDDLPLLAACKDDARAYYGYTTVDKKRYEIQVREAAAAMSLLLREQDFEKYGFERADWQVWWIRTHPAPFKALHWCETDKGRAAALKAAWEWLDKQPKVEPKRAEPKPDPCAALVERLRSNDFATREAAEKELRALGLRAEPALRAGAKSDDPEVRARCAKLLVAVRKDALAELVRTFDAKTDAPSAHPVWKRFADTAGNTPASRTLFARLLKHPAWVARLDAAETGPDEARRQYREALRDVVEVVSANLKVFFVIPVWPCDTPDQTAFLLFLGSYPGTDGPLPNEEKFGAFIGLANSEARVTYARGLPLALEGKEIAPGPNNKYDATAALPDGSAKAFAKLLAAWLPRRAEPSPLFHGFELALAHGATDVLPAARAIAADAERPVASRLAALAAVAQFGDASDLKLFAPLFDDKTQLVIPPPPQNGDARPRSRRPVVADRAIGLALLLTDRDPFDFGFEYAKGKFRRASGRPVVSAYEFEEFGFSNDGDRAAAHKKAKAVLVEKVPKR